MSDLYEHLYYSTLDFKTMSQLQRLVSAYRPHGTAAYQDLTGADRKAEKDIAHLAGEWKHPAIGEDDKTMDLVRTQHQMTRSYHCLEENQ